MTSGRCLNNILGKIMIKSENLLNSESYENTKVLSLKNKFIRFNRKFFFISFLFRNKTNKISKNIKLFLKNKKDVHEKLYLFFIIESFEYLKYYFDDINKLINITDNNKYTDVYICLHILDLNSYDNNIINNKIEVEKYYIDVNFDSLNNFDSFLNYNLNKKLKPLVLNLININNSNIENFLKIIKKFPTIINNKRVNRIRIPHFPCWQLNYDFPKHEQTLQKETYKYIFNGIKYLKIPVSQNWFTDYSYCIADHWNHYLIDENGKIFNCFFKFANNSNIGKINTKGEIMLNYPSIIDNISRDVFVKKKCVNCHFLNYCFGGCNQKKYSCPII